MKCKSCNFQLELSAKYCANCGGKIINKRLSLKGTTTEFIIPFFNWDNNFFKTIRHLNNQPHKVLNAYISGARKKYFKPFPFLILFATFGLIFNNFFPLVEAGENDNADAVLNIMNDYHNWFSIFSIPVIALISYLSLKKYNNNYAEHLVFQCYIMSFIGFIGFIIQPILVNILKMNTLNYSAIYIVAIMLYANYAFIAKYELNFKSTLIANLKFWFFLIISYILIAIVVGAIVMLVFNNNKF